MKVACIQMNSGPDIEKNLADTEALIRDAAAQGAKFISTPENTCHMLTPQSKKIETSPLPEDHPARAQFSALAKELGVYILIGSVSVKVSDDKVASRSLMFADNGDIVAEYDKIHLFDVDLESGETYRESAVVQAGDKLALADSNIGKVGLTICYDVRFSHLYRDLAHKGAEVLTVPSAFTVPTGKAHWEALLRARAIENGAFVIAAAQCGEHHGGRKTYGHSMIIGPWGKVLAEGGDEPGVIIADIEPHDARRAKQAIPSLRHDRDYK